MGCGHVNHSNARDKNAGTAYSPPMDVWSTTPAGQASGIHNFRVAAGSLVNRLSTAKNVSHAQPQIASAKLYVTLCAIVNGEKGV